MRVNKIEQIAEDFADRLIKGEKILLQDVLKQYPKLAKKLKPELEMELLLYTAGREERKLIEKELPKHKKELWAILEQKLLEKQLHALEKRTAKVKDILPLKHRADFLLLLLYVKGKANRFNEGIRGITRLIKLAFLLAQETNLAKMVKSYYQFIPYKIGPFDPNVYEDLQVLEMAKLVEKHTYSYTRPIDDFDQKIDEGFKFNDILSVYTLTEKGMRYAEALSKWANKKDETIVPKLHILKSYYGQSSLKQLLRYIYKKYPEYATESDVIEKILK